MRWHDLVARLKKRDEIDELLDRHDIVDMRELHQRFAGGRDFITSITRRELVRD